MVPENSLIVFNSRQISGVLEKMRILTVKNWDGPVRLSLEGFFWAPFDAVLTSFVDYVPIPNEAEIALK